jgi:GTPase SAR1 family protein
MKSETMQCIDEPSETLTEAMYVFHGRSITLKSNYPKVISEIDKIYGLFRTQDKSNLHMELTVLVKDQDTSLPENFQIYSTFPSHCDGWEREWWMKDLKKEIEEPREGLRTYSLGVSETMGWLHQINFTFLLFILFSMEDLCPLHAGVVALNGKGLILPGKPGSGKSTLTYALIKRGFRFLSDDFAFVDPKTRGVLPFPKSFTFRPEASSLFEEVKKAFERGDIIWVTETKCYLNLRKMGITELGSPINVDYIVFPTYDPESPKKLKKISKKKAAQKLVDGGSLFSQANPKRIKFSLQDLASQLTESAECYELVTSELEDTIDSVFTIMNGNRSKEDLIK